MLFTFYETFWKEGKAPLILSMFFTFLLFAKQDQKPTQWKSIFGKNPLLISVLPSQYPGENENKT